MAPTTPSKHQVRIQNTDNQAKQIMFYLCYLTKPRKSEALGGTPEGITVHLFKNGLIHGIQYALIYYVKTTIKIPPKHN